MKESVRYIDNQLDVLRRFIHENINADYVYVDVPLYWNIGDWLIALGAWELLKEVPHKCMGRWRWEDYERANISPDTIIILQGGGNFGDLWRGATEARNEVIKRYPNNKIIILSQTITYINKTLLQKDAELYSKHRNLYICARDDESYNIAQEYFSANNLYMIPDTAIGLYNSLPKYTGEIRGKRLVLNRRDKEVDSLFSENGDVREWEDILRDIHFEYIYIPYRFIRKTRKVLRCSYLLRFENWYMLHILYPFVRKKIPAYFLKYNEIYTTRLHGYILAEIMQIPTIVKDNKYHKLSNYIRTWMQ